MASLSGIFVGDRAPPAMADATSTVGMPTRNTAAVPNFADAISTAQPVSVIIAGFRTLRRSGSEMASVTGKPVRTPKNRWHGRCCGRGGPRRDARVRAPSPPAGTPGSHGPRQCGPPYPQSTRRQSRQHPRSLFFERLRALRPCFPEHKMQNEPNSRPNAFTSNDLRAPKRTHFRTHSKSRQNRYFW